MPKIDGILETSLYVNDLARAAAFYRDVLGFALLFESRRLIALDAGRRGVLLLFPKGVPIEDSRDESGLVPGHGGQGRLHLAFAIAAEDLEAWRARLADRGVPLIGEYHWGRGGTSLYFNDADGHVLELATPGLWATY
jgi:catechol 2,3-dioxygenase-like lactoylglutathione lyase family enzyme